MKRSRKKHEFISVLLLKKLLFSSGDYYRHISNTQNCKQHMHNIVHGSYSSNPPCSHAKIFKNFWNYFHTDMQSNPVQIKHIFNVSVTESNNLCHVSL